ncbi:hypothetical protein ACHAXN_006099 [Cyclotella atomus]
MMEADGAAPSSGNPIKRTRPTRKRTAPPPQDKLVLVFISASTIFACITLSPFLFGRFPQHDEGGLFSPHNHTGLHQSRLQDIILSMNEDLHDSGSGSELPLARGSSGLPMSDTPSLQGARHGSITCTSSTDSGDFKLDELAYWNEPGPYDTKFTSPFAPKDAKSKRYVTFEPDRGGWNNIRMSMEIIFVFAAATGRTLVLPPDAPFYLLTENEGKGSKQHGFADFIDVRKIQGLDIITMTKFLEREGQEGGLLKLPTGIHGEKIRKSAEYCYYMAKADRPCDEVFEFLKDQAYVPELQAGRDCLIFDQATRMRKASLALDSELFHKMPQEKQQQVTQFCTKRNPIFFGGELDSAPLIHFHSGNKYHRLLNHFYTFMYFTDPKVDNHFKRFVRDNLHYDDTIYCAAGKIIQLLQDEAARVGKETGGSGYSAMHIRRGDFQYKKTKISADEWLNATIGVLHPGEIVYIATDETDRSFFEPLKEHYNVKFLDQFSQAAGLDDLDPNYAGMIDTIIASRGRVFFGTWFSTFSGYINRMRGYHGFPGNASYYGQPERLLSMHKWEDPDKVLTAREWPVGWVGIDGDVAVDHFIKG